MQARSSRHSLRRPLARAVLGITSIATLSALLIAPPAPAAQPASIAGRQSAAPGSTVARASSTIDWTRCDRGSSLRCARLRVPLDYDRPSGDKISLAMAMLPARHPDRRIGSLFVNPGGPGGEARGVVPFIAKLLGPGVRNRFDVIGIDPRGIGGSAHVVCRSADPAPPFPFLGFPFTGPQVKKFLRADHYVRKACAEGGNAILDHMTTADTARDMDRVRAAVGDDQLSYYGISYGTYLGATYAAMFPGNVRAIAVDGVLDPIEWSTGRHDTGRTVPFSTRLGSHRGAHEALVSAFAECDRVGKTRCAFAGNALHKWRQIVDKLARGPVRVQGFKLHYQDVINIALSDMYSRPFYRFLMRGLQGLHEDMFGRHRASAATSGVPDAWLRKAARGVDPRNPVGPYGYGPAFSDGFHGVACADSVNPSDPTTWIAAGKRADRQAAWFGRLWTWVSSTCAHWPGSHADAFRGPWHVDTANPLMIVGNTHDPATPISGARAVHRIFDGSRLVTLNTWGHGAIGESACVTQRFQDYFVHLDLPRDGLVCRPDKHLFPARH